MLLAADEQPPVQRLGVDATSPFLLTADHAGRLIPKALGDLGLDEVERSRHIAWDIGIRAVTERLAKTLGATAILQAWSRLVIDCNRRPGVASSIPEISETTVIPGNLHLTDADREARRSEVFAPYHDAIAAEIAARKSRGQPTLYIAMHSFTPVFKGTARPMHVAVLYNRAPRLSRALAAFLRAEPGLVVAENEPYSVSDDTDYGVPVHAERGGLDYVEIEIRQDLITDAAGQGLWADRLARLLPQAAATLEQR